MLTQDMCQASTVKVEGKEGHERGLYGGEGWLEKMKEKQVQALSERSSCSTAATVQLKSTATESSLNPEDGSDDDDHLIQNVAKKILLLKF